MTTEVLDLFAGPGGWDVGARELGLDPLGVELDSWACATRKAAGLRTVKRNVARYTPDPFDGLIASPPCPSFSMAGKGKGRVDLPHLHRFVERWARRGWTDPNTFHQWADPRTPLVLQPLRYIDLGEPEWVVMEQVVPVVGLWERIAKVLVTKRGWKGAWAGVLNAADFGVPQTRKRAILIAHRTRTVHAPEPTHSKNPEPTLFGELEPWVSMGQALGWDGYVEEIRGEGRVARHGERPAVPTSEPHPAMTTGDYRRRRYVLDRRQTGAPTVDVGVEPCPTIVGTQLAKGVWTLSDDRTPIKLTIHDGLTLQSFPDDYPIQGNKQQQWMQIGNAVPPRLARHILATVL